MAKGGGIIYDEKFEIDKSELEKRGIKPFPIPLTKIAQEEGGAKIMANTASIGAMAGLTDFDLNYINNVIEENFKVKGKQVVQNNIQVARAGYKYAESVRSDFDYTLEPIKEAPARMILSGNQAFCLGVLASGCNFISAYPMTPSTSIFEWLTKQGDRYGIVSKQTEDELAAITMAIGAAHVGARSMASTSGGGFSLMTEALGLAGMTETPIVIAEVQRPGPSTGFPTRTEQGDLLFAIHASQGEFPRIVLTPGTIEEYFRTGAKAFNLAEKYQLPVVILADQHLADSIRAVDPKDIDMDAVKIDRGEFLTADDLDNLEEEYKRHKFTDTGISPRAVPYHQNAVYKTTGNEHNEKGDIIEDSKLRTKMMDKRMKKLETARVDIESPVLYGSKEAEITFFSWGSSYGAIKEAVDILNHEGREVNLCHIKDAWPLPKEEISEVLADCNRPIMVEGNHSGQMAQLIRGQTGKEITEKILRYDGRPLTPDYIIQKLEGLKGGG
jgi:2-oxoglutarate ferredoxin oxidoreductase subunit alpha